MNNSLNLYQATVLETYRNILNDILSLLHQYPTPQMRTYIEYGTIEDGVYCEHSFYSILLYLSLTLDDRRPTIAFAQSSELRWRVDGRLETALTRAIFRRTEKTATAIDIEDCLEPLIYVDGNLEEAEEKLRKRVKGYKRIRVKFKGA